MAICTHVVLKWDETNPTGITITRYELMRLWSKLSGTNAFDATSNLVGKLLVPNFSDQAYETAISDLTTRFTSLVIQKLV